jgi:NADH dehydrogenase
MHHTQSRPKVVIVGGGFAGIEAVKTLRKLGTSVDITVVSKSPTFEYYPALYKLVTGALPIEVSVPLATVFRSDRVQLVEATYTGLDSARQVISVVDSTGVSQEISYDYLILALGSETNFFNIKGLSELSHSFKSVTAALKLKRHFCELFAGAQGLAKEELVERFHILVVGGGPSGVELAGDLRSFFDSSSYRSRC